MKAMNVLDASKAFFPFLKNDSVVITLQNGIVEDYVATIVGKRRIIGAVGVWASTVDKLGIQITKISSLHPQDIRLNGSESPSESQNKYQIIQEIFCSYMYVKPSTLQSLERG